MGAIEDRDLLIRVWLDVQPWCHGEHREGLAHVRRVSPDAGDAEPGLAALGEQS
jgi:hypothetical protein